MFRKLLAYKELLRLGRAGKMFRDVHHFFKAIVLEVLVDMNFFSDLSTPKSFFELSQNYNVKDEEYLKLILETLVTDGFLTHNDGVYQTKRHPEPVVVKPSFFNDSIADLLKAYARNIPQRLQGRRLEFSEGITLFDWDDALSTKMYEVIRRAPFTYVNPFKKPGKLVDIGCGNGYGTAAIWLYHLKRGLFYPGTKVKIYGIEPDKGLLEIAKEEFALMVKRHRIDIDDISDKIELYHPVFSEGSINSIPFDDESVDYVFASQVLHWTEPISAIKECYRVIKPGGVFFGTENFKPQANAYTDLLIRVVDNARGFFFKEDMVKWGTEAGFHKMDFTTPISIFKFQK
ncbi:MAG: class I SAM-dependent methyltransferase [Candidatus Hodarchaeales archaeon]